MLLRGVNLSHSDVSGENLGILAVRILRQFYWCQFDDRTL